MYLKYTRPNKIQFPTKKIFCVGTDFATRNELEADKDDKTCGNVPKGFQFQVPNLRVSHSKIIEFWVAILYYAIL